jgi:hypothetical protein
VKRYALTAMFFLLTFALCAAAFSQVFTRRGGKEVELPPNVETLVIKGMCDDWKAWKVKSDMVVTCGNTPAPSGAVELRPFYVVR